VPGGVRAGGAWWSWGALTAWFYRTMAAHEAEARRARMVALARSKELRRGGRPLPHHGHVVPIAVKQLPWTVTGLLLLLLGCIGGFVLWRVRAL